jgi:hypothetical protein
MNVAKCRSDTKRELATVKLTARGADSAARGKSSSEKLRARLLVGGDTLKTSGKIQGVAQLFPDQVLLRVLLVGVSDPHSPACVPCPNCSVALCSWRAVKNVLLSLASVNSASISFRPSTIRAGTVLLQ